MPFGLFHSKITKRLLIQRSFLATVFAEKQGTIDPQCCMHSRLANASANARFVWMMHLVFSSRNRSERPSIQFRLPMVLPKRRNVLCGALSKAIPTVQSMHQVLL